MKISHSLIFVVVALQSTIALGQLSGYYTIGGPNADFATMAEAKTELYSSGMAGDVTFALNPGEYDGFKLWKIPGASQNQWFILESASNDTSDVIINGLIELSWPEYITIRKLTMKGGILVRASGKLILEGNAMYEGVDIGYADQLKDNSVYGDGEINISAGYYINNRFYGGLSLSGSSVGMGCDKTVIGNYFDVPIHFAFQEKIHMIDNIFMQNINLFFNDELLFTGNIMYGNLEYGDVYLYNWRYWINNNIFVGGYVRSVGHNSTISYNSFIDGARLILEYCDIQVHDNCFCRPIEGCTSTDNIYHNNYYPLMYCYYDTLSLHYNPMYHPERIGIATNPLLQGKGMTEAPDIDFLGIERKNPPAIGANEILICSAGFNNTIEVDCGDEIYTNICNLPDTGNFWWMPDSSVQNPDSVYTKIIAYNDDIVYLYNSEIGLIDSIIIHVSPFLVEIAPMPVFYCGYARTLNASYHPKASYSWSPVTGLSNPYIRNPKLLIEDTANLQYILRCEIPNCGVSCDTLNVNFDPSPHVGIYFPSQNFDTVFFSCFSICVDEYLWDFGDGQYSTDENPWHIYDKEGEYEITLTGQNQFASSSHTVIYHFYLLNIHGDYLPEITIQPNPANSFVRIKGLNPNCVTLINIVDLFGKRVKSEEAGLSETIVNISDLSPGVYILYISNCSNDIARKIIVI